MKDLSGVLQFDAVSSFHFRLYQQMTQSTVWVYYFDRAKTKFSLLTLNVCLQVAFFPSCKKKLPLKLITTCRQSNSDMKKKLDWGPSTENTRANSGAALAPKKQEPEKSSGASFESQEPAKIFTRSQFFEPKLDDCMYLACSISCINGPDLFVQMLMSVLYFCCSFRFHHQKQKDLYNLLQ